VEVVVVDDIAAGDFTEALKDITAVIHVASPLPGRAEPAEVLSGAIEGTIRVIRQGQKAGIKQFSVISSIAATQDWDSGTADMFLTEESWNHETRERALEPGRTPRFVYSASKALAEKEVWKVADEFPDVNITTLNPPFFIGPNAPCQSIGLGETAAFSTNLIVYNFVLPDSKQQTPFFGFVDVKDVAAGLVAGIRAKGRNRALLTGEFFELKDAIDYIASVRPELRSRLINPEPTGQTRPVMDNSRALEMLGLQSVSSWKENVLETVDYVLKIEKEWIEAGVDVESTLRASLWRT
jgi:nucleoside-diphosphate-sugar epimerase